MPAIPVTMLFSMTNEHVYFYVSSSAWVRDVLWIELIARV